MSDPGFDPLVLRALFDESPDMVALSHFSGAVIDVNPVGLHLVGLEELPAAGLSTADFFTARGLEVAVDVEHALKTAGHWQGRTELRHFGSGAGIPIALSTFVVRRSGHEPDVIATIIRDRTRGHQRDLDLLAAAASAQRTAIEQRALAELSALAVTADFDTVLSAATTTAATLIGVESAALARHASPADLFLSFDAVTRTLREAVPVGTGAGSLTGYALARRTTTVCSDIDTETRFDTSAMSAMGFRCGAAVPITIGSGLWGALILFGRTPYLFGDGDIAFVSAVAGVLSAALERVELDRELRWRSAHDPLTELPNRAVAYDAIDAALVRAEETGDRVALLLLDVDDFKIINDSLGHDVGDRALVRFSRRLAATAKPGDTVARLGGDEFLMICNGIDDVAHAEAVAEAIRVSLASPSVEDDDEPIPVSASIGVAVSEPGSSRRELLRSADLAMYRAKDTRAGHAVFDSSDLYDADRVRSMSVDLRRALAFGDLTLDYQPVIDIETGHIVSVEALARWQHPQLGTVAPSEFVAVAERTGVATLLDDWALTTACRQLVDWRGLGCVCMRVNISALQLRDPAFPDRVAAALLTTGAHADGVVLELTETEWLADTGTVASNLARLHEMGVALSLDDVGKGYSSLAYLERFPVIGSFKIDRTYIDALDTERGREVLTAIVSLAKAYGVTVVGEGVETQAQLDALTAAGCNLVQGFLLGRPADAEHTALLLSRDSAARQR
ncbi:EAL domain-containing protein [Rhodococcus fascians]|nr:EAL domain-containing protein [Rhodococcus fascians]MBY3995167.1 EAL domain-containing protein [Rhodococcus fascians]MBY4000513.1 EAL domain-containing protein [Rhodococcus fascians]MBY4005541.1 EAL domain-containing protein [Rhodococcus fascians]MBY4016374.1 EAL domain-containing protein [Rhodococcus fascians]